MHKPRGASTIYCSPENREKNRFRKSILRLIDFHASEWVRLQSIEVKCLCLGIWRHFKHSRLHLLSQVKPFHASGYRQLRSKRKFTHQRARRAASICSRVSEFQLRDIRRINSVTMTPNRTIGLHYVVISRRHSALTTRRAVNMSQLPVVLASNPSTWIFVHQRILRARLYKEHTFRICIYACMLPSPRDGRSSNRSRLRYSAIETPLSNKVVTYKQLVYARKNQTSTDTDRYVEFWKCVSSLKRKSTTATDRPTMTSFLRDVPASAWPCLFAEADEVVYCASAYVRLKTALA